MVDGGDDERRVERSTHLGRPRVRLIAVAVVVIAAVGGGVAAALLRQGAAAPQV